MKECCKRWYEAKRIIEVLGNGPYGYAYPDYKYIHFCPVCGEKIDGPSFDKYVEDRGH